MISVVIPIYNKERELARCINSVTHQSYSDLEIILVNDGSTDGSLKICEEFKEKDSRIIVENKENGGVSTARNAGIELANGEWIMFVDPDDVIYTTLVQRLIDYVYTKAEVISACLSIYDMGSQQYGDIDFDQIKDEVEKVSFYDSDFIFSDSDYTNYEKLEKRNKKELFLELFNDNYGSDQYRRNGIGTPCVKLYNKQFLDDHMLRFHPELVRMQDNIFNMEVFDKAEKIVYINEPLYLYDTGHKEGFQRKYDPRAKEYYDKVLRYRFDFCKEKGWLSGDYYNEFSAGVVEITSAILKHYFLNKQNPKSQKDLSIEMETFFSNMLYQNAFYNINRGKTRCLMNFRVELLKRKMYSALFLMENIILFLKKGYSRLK